MIKLVTDSTSDLPPAVARQYGIEVVPLYVHFGEKVYREGVELSNEQFFAMLKTSPKLPTTSQPSAGDFLEVYKRLSADGSQIISLHLSSLLSGTYSSGCAARDMLGNPNIHVVDTTMISASQGLMAIEAARMASAGQPVEAILARLESMIKNSALYFVVDTLEYLHKGGRIGGAQALVGTALQLKPILTLQAGRVEACERIRTRAKAVARLKDIVLQGVAGRERVYLGILHAAAPDEARRLRDDLARQIEPVETMFFEVGPVIAVHTGPGALGVAYFAE